MDRLKRFFGILMGAMFALFAMPAFAKDHIGIDPIDHLQNHLRQAEFWIGQGEWVVAFSQPVCTSELTWQTAVTHWLFVQGGGLFVIVGISLATLFLLGRQIMRPSGKSMQFLPKQQTNFA